MNKYGISFFTGAALLALTSVHVQAGGVYEVEGSMKDTVSDAVMVPAPMPIPNTTAWYIRGDVGYTSIEDSSVVEDNQFTLADTNIDDTFSFGGGVGYYFTARLRGDITIDYINSAQVTGNNTGGGAIGVGTREFNISSTVALANVYFDLDRYGRFSPYVGVGVGMAFNSTESGEAIPNGSITGGSEDGLAYALIAGVSTQMSQGLHLDVNYRYLHLGEVRTGDIFNTSGLTAANDGGALAVDDLNVHQVRVGVRAEIW